MNVRYHFIRDCIEAGHVSTEHVKSDENLEDPLTKSVPRTANEKFKKRVALSRTQLNSHKCLAEC